MGTIFLSNAIKLTFHRLRASPQRFRAIKPKRKIIQRNDSRIKLNYKLQNNKSFD